MKAWGWVIFTRLARPEVIGWFHICFFFYFYSGLFSSLFPLETLLCITLRAFHLCSFPTYMKEEPKASPFTVIVFVLKVQVTSAFSDPFKVPQTFLQRWWPDPQPFSRLLLVQMLAESQRWRINISCSQNWWRPNMTVIRTRKAPRDKEPPCCSRRVSVSYS